jgi:hypothetical protein
LLLAVDINGNNVAFDSMDRSINIKTEEYFLKRRRLQSRPRLDEKRHPGEIWWLGEED